VVREAVTTAVTREKASEAARKAAEQLAASLDQGGSVAAAAGSGWQSAGFIGRRDSAVPEPIRLAAFAMARPAANKVNAAAVVTNEGAAVALVSAVRPAPPADDIVRRLRLQALQFEQGQTALAAYVADLRAKAEVSKNLESF
jgi:hypothetical protein